MLINCSTKGCMKQTEAKLNRQTGEVICMECGSPITNVSEYIKRVLLSQGQVLRSAEKKSFQVHCPTCGGKRDVQLVEEGRGGAQCAVCGSDLRLSAAFIHALKTKLEAEKQDSGEDAGEK